jgi:peptidoglycan-N-acetylglucosamine deacetylase
MGRRGLAALLAVPVAVALPAPACGVAASKASVGPPTGGTTAGARAVGCTSRPDTVVTSGPPDGRRVALTFDDGPSTGQTPAILVTLNRLGAVATFFEEGHHVDGRQQLMEEILASGDEIGNHTFHHSLFPGPMEIKSAERAIRAATGFRPCLFRPPYGLLSDAVRAAAGGSGLETVLWDVDSEDDRLSGAGVIRGNVLRQVTAGSIILLHDGGHHPQTVRALPGIVRGLRARGYRLVTVTELLGGRFLYRRGAAAAAS